MGSTDRLRRIAAGCALLVAGNFAAWAWAWAAFAGSPVLLTTALLAYTFGLRHAIDADHIAAIDNATRKLIETGRPAGSTGFFFALGHSAVVVLASLGMAMAAGQLQSRFGNVVPMAGMLATWLSALCLLGLAIANTAALVAIGRSLAAGRRGKTVSEAELRRLLVRRGFLARLFRGVFALVTRSWHMALVGLLFGLGFDTATEIGALGLSAAAASNGLPLTAILVFPVLFAAGMALVDTLDAVLMMGAYRWAAAEPRRRVWYNLMVTALSVFVAVAIGAIELLGLFAGSGGEAGGIWRLVAYVNEHFALVGGFVVGLFAASWLFAAMIGRARNHSLIRHGRA
jgi:high-affinity nickel-transport protein